ncbi:16S rRNA (uracil(1498)-N(3))-methyltransferase [Desulfovibrio sp. 86]|uniref:Ribosomal RNA small subunit methyltransferase E n=1 Tax=uncultured Desulfovibrio sp. TaxID=167968 RepID=A0A212KY82_9BACT|nr:16S rRNA (uracil(1498)-N(3))-methyltransferase [Desulfovibrio sp. 86]SCM70217.1 Ribosomal RNA small subunit methyltransferase E [uncultured Desulfovibrio sp.]VZH32137.1 Ribosomal RNA small subunit methyltransferase E [Desulfovibrio sp. 86]
MSLALFYLPPEHWGHEVCLDGQEARHLSQVLRIAPGSEVGLLDGRGRLGRFVVLKAGKKTVNLECRSEEFLPQPEARAVVALAYSKAVRRGFFMEKAVELGAAGIWLWQGDHSQGKLSAAAQEACQGQLVAGAKQCGNPWLPEVCVLGGGVDDLVRQAAEADYRILPWEAQDAVPMLSPTMAGQRGLTVYVIGPEGGFSQRELALLTKSGFCAVSLGTRVLRCETAATLCLGIHWWASQLPEAPPHEAERS